MSLSPQASPQPMMNKPDLQQVSRRFPSRIILTGFRATGKTAVGKRLADLTGFQFFDTDREISERMGCSIAESVNRDGWVPFREHERVLLSELPSWRETIIATGGGAVLHHREWKALHRCSFAVWLRTDIATTLSRLGQDKKTAEQRPSLGHKKDEQGATEEISALLAERAPLYRAGSDMVLNTEGRTPEELAEAIYVRL